MRWDGLFADLEAQADALSAAERSAEVEERTRLEVGRGALVDRLRPAVGDHLQFNCVGPLIVRGELRRLGADWCLVEEGAGREALVALSAVCVVAGLRRLSAPADSANRVEARFGLRQLLRGVARDRSAVRLRLRDASTLDGTLDRVGADFVEVAAHPAGEARRRSQVQATLIVPIEAIAVVGRDG